MCLQSSPPEIHSLKCIPLRTYLTQRGAWDLQIPQDPHLIWHLQPHQGGRHPKCRSHFIPCHPEEPLQKNNAKKEVTR